MRDKHKQIVAGKPFLSARRFPFFQDESHLIDVKQQKGEDYSDLVQQRAAAQQETEQLDAAVKALLAQRDAALLGVGNVLHPSVPVGDATVRGGRGVVE